MKKQIQYLILGLVLSVNLAVLAQSWFTEGSQPLKTDTDVRSLQKINYLQWAGTGNGAVPLASATQVTMAASGANALDTSGNTLAQIATTSATTYWVRKVIVTAGYANANMVYVSAGSTTFAQLAAGNEYVISAPEGSVININLITAKADSGTVAVQLITFR